VDRHGLDLHAADNSARTEPDPAYSKRTALDPTRGRATQNNARKLCNDQRFSHRHRGPIPPGPRSFAFAKSQESGERFASANPNAVINRMTELSS
jgi:hypothetical protein